MSISIVCLARWRGQACGGVIGCAASMIPACLIIDGLLRICMDVHTCLAGYEPGRVHALCFVVTWFHRRLAVMMWLSVFHEVICLGCLGVHAGFRKFSSLLGSLDAALV